MATKESKMVDEYIEAVWMLTERGNCTENSIKAYFDSDFDQNIIDQLLRLELITVKETGELTYTPTGEKKGRTLIRAHRIAERLLYDVL